MDRHAEHLARLLGHSGERHGGVGEEHLGQHDLVHLDGVRFAFIGGEVVDQAHKYGDIGTGGRSEDHGVSRTRPIAWRLSM